MRVLRTRFGPVFGAVVGLVVVLAGCAGPDLAPSPMTFSRSESTPPVAVEPADWPTYHHDNERTGVAPQLAPVGRLDQAWQAGLDGAVYGQPLLIGARLIAATERDTVYALDSDSGQVLWSTSLGEPIARSDLPCGNIDPLGITGTPAYDPATGSIFVVAETADGTQTLAGIDLTNGAVVLRRALPPPQGEEIAHQQRGALTVLDGWVYVAYGGLAGDCGSYVGSVVAAPTVGTAPLRSFAVPTTREAGIWAPSGGTVHNGMLFYAVGNGESTEQYDFSDSVLALTPALALADSFSPVEWAADNEADLDLGSMGPVAVGEHILAIGKSGTGYLLDDAHLGGVGGQLASQQICGAYGGSAVVGSTVFVPCNDGTRAVNVESTNELRVLWHTPVPANGSPVVGGGAVWVTDYDHGILYALDPATGQPLDQLNTGDLPHFASPTLGGNRAYLGTMHGVIAVRGA